MKKFLTAILSVLLVVTVSLFVAACQPAPKDDDKNPGGNPPIETPETDVDITISDESLKVSLEGHQLYVTSIGQAADYDTMLNLLVQSMGLTEGTDFKANATLTADKVADGDTVIIVAGASTKGMGDAGINIASELERANAFVAKKNTVNLIVVQLNAARRGTDSDNIYAVVCPAAKVNLIITAANSDGKFSNEWSKDKPLYLYTRGSKMVDSFKFILGK